ncbi:MAG TPA: phage tail protein [Rhizomicrobium sp.]|nr:phage tail protein [Rhizomicrobium sp.]
MTKPLQTFYRFQSEDQWDACLFLGADRETAASRATVAPFAPFAVPGTRFPSQGGRAPAVACDQELVWCDEAGHLLRLPYADDRPSTARAPFGPPARLVATEDSLWAADGALQVFARDSLTRRLLLASGGVVDIAGDGRGGVFALIASEIVRFDCVGREIARFAAGIDDASQLAYLSSGNRLVVLGNGRTRLAWISARDGELLFTLPLSAVRVCFEARALASDGRARLVLAGSDGAAFGGAHHAVVLDGEANALGDVVLDEPPTGVALSRNLLLATSASGLTRFSAATTVPADSPDLSVSLMTPVLRSSQEVRPWLRAEASVSLPQGCAIEIAFASTGDPAVRDRVAAVDAKLPAGERQARMRAAFDNWQSFTFQGDAAISPDVPLSVPLYDVTDAYLVVAVTLIASPGGGLPVLTKLDVLYPGTSLMENLPVVYQRQAADKGNYLRALVGVLEATTQNLDARIQALGSMIHPATAPGNWLDYVARWLGLPWDDAMSLDQKRALIGRAADIAQGYGTRAALQALLESIVSKGRFRIVDATADHGFTVLGDSALPAMLSGLPIGAAELNNKLILGRARLSCDESETARHVGRIRVDVGASAAEEVAWKPWLEALVQALMPATATLALHWVGPLAFETDKRLGDEIVLDAPTDPHLGTDSVTGIARLPRRGPDPGTSLQ